MISDRLHHSLDRLRRRHWKVESAAAAAIAFLGAALLILGAAGVDVLIELPAPLRLAVLFASLTLAAILAGRLLWRAYQRQLPAALARQLDAAVSTRGQVLVGVDLSASAGYDSEISRALADMAVAKAADIASDARPHSVVSIAPAVRAASACGGLLAVCLLVALIAPRLVHTEGLRFLDPFGDHPPYSFLSFDVRPGNAEVVYGDGIDIDATIAGGAVDAAELVYRSPESSWQRLPLFAESDNQWRATITDIHRPLEYYIRARSARSHRFQLRVRTVPQIVKVIARVKPPAYSRIAAYEGPPAPSGIAGLMGTEIEFEATSNRPLKGGTIQLREGDSTRDISMSPPSAGSDQVRGAFTLSATGTASIAVVDVEGQASREPFRIPFALLKDEPPTVQILEPPVTSFATPNITLPLAIAATDDYGVAKVALYRSLNASRALPQDLSPKDAPPPKRTEDGVTFPFSSFGLQPGDTLRFYGRAVDNDPTGGKGAESAIATVQIISEETFRQLMLRDQGLEALAEKQQIAAGRLRKSLEKLKDLQEQIESADPKPKLSKENAEKLDELRRQLEQDADILKELSKQKLDLDIDDALAEKLLKRADKMKKASERLAGMPQSPEERKKLLDQLKKELEQELDEAQEDAKNAESLTEIYPLVEDEQRYLELVRRQRELATRLHSLKKADDPDSKRRLREFEAEQRKLQQELRELLDDIEQHARNLPDQLDDEKMQQEIDELRASSLDFVDKLRSSGALDEMAEAESSMAALVADKAHDHADRAATILEKFIKECNGMGADSGKMCKRAFGPKKSGGSGLGIGETLAQLLGRRGMGGGSGYSAQRNSSQNAGLYGPALAGKESNRSGRNGNRRGGQTRESSLPNRSEVNSDFDAPTKTTSTAGVDAAVPGQYRQRVAKYFERIADEVKGTKRP